VLTVTTHQAVEVLGGLLGFVIVGFGVVTGKTPLPRGVGQVERSDSPVAFWILNGVIAAIGAMLIYYGIIGR